MPTKKTTKKSTSKKIEKCTREHKYTNEQYKKDLEKTRNFGLENEELLQKIFCVASGLVVSGIVSEARKGDLIIALMRSLQLLHENKIIKVLK